MDKNMDKNLVKRIMDEFNSKNYEYRDMDITSVRIDDRKFGFKIIENDGWQEDGQYQHIYYLGQLVEYNDKWEIVEEFDIYFSQNGSRSGSYFTDWYYDFDEIEEMKRVETLIPEQVIPEHIKVTYEIKNKD